MDRNIVLYKFIFSKIILLILSYKDFLEELLSLLYTNKLENLLNVRLLNSYDPNRPIKVIEEKTNIIISRGFVPNVDLIKVL